MNEVFYSIKCKPQIVWQGFKYYFGKSKALNQMIVYFVMAQLSFYSNLIEIYMFIFYGNLQICCLMGRPNIIFFSLKSHYFSSYISTLLNLQQKRVLSVNAV